MTRTIGTTRSQRVENATPLSGTESIEVNAAEELSQQITALTEEEVTLGDFKAPQLQAISLLADQIVDCQFLGTRHAILQTANAAPSTITHTPNITERIFGGDIVRVEGTVADDGLYLVDNVAFGAVTTISLALGMTFPAGAGGAVGTFARVCSHQDMTMSYSAATVTAATGVITFTGDISDKFAVGDAIKMVRSTANDGLWRITAVTTDGPPVVTTSITVEDIVDAGLLPSDVNDGFFNLVRPAFELAANVPYQWTHDSGQRNPFFPIGADPTGGVILDETFFDDRGEVTVCMVDNLASSAANFQAILSKNSIL